MNIHHTRAMVKAALSGALDAVEFEQDPVFGFAVPKSCPNVPSGVLNPRNTWNDKTAYDKKAAELKQMFDGQIAKLRSSV
jgi:phosphoenolpyruvate carboxykinase (ATP)